ncbi:NAD(P)H-dependent oxidoreductase [Ilyomonas limi]|uniref:NAD(P)H-dependent oxidoreductase n=1 Tax=Ilyomonas limi TaxID=2575867 RepID=A0A4U3KVI1_9BACT|nr:NAD(P)H-dependent oxidoreductase [Ilyomonas limi]
MSEADVSIFVTDEYDYDYPAPLPNALEYLHHEWNYKATCLVSYGDVYPVFYAVHQ